MISRLLSTAAAVLALASLHQTAMAQTVRSGYGCPSGKFNIGHSGPLVVPPGVTRQASWRRWTVLLDNTPYLPISRDVAIGIDVTNSPNTGYVPIAVGSTNGTTARGRVTLQALNSSGQVIFSSSRTATASGQYVRGNAPLPTGTTRSNARTYRIYIDTPGSSPVPNCSTIYMYD